MLRRVAPALGLFFLSPLVGEFLLGNVSIDALPIGLAMAPMYGGGAVLIREVARRAGKGWPTMILLALAFGAIEEGLICQTLFNPSYFGFELLREAYIPALGIGAWWTLFVLTLHTVWSISVPIAIIESLVPERATTPWLGLPGLTVMSVLYVLGSALVFWGTYQQERFIATPPQMLGVIASVIALLTAAFRVWTRSLRSEPRGAGTVAGRSLRVPDREHVHDLAVCRGGLADRHGIRSPLCARRGRGRALVRKGRLGSCPSAGPGGRRVADLCLAFVPAETRAWLWGRHRPGRKRRLLDRRGSSPRRSQSIRPSRACQAFPHFRIWHSDYRLRWRSDSDGSCWRISPRPRRLAMLCHARSGSIGLRARLKRRDSRIAAGFD